jgi:integrase
MKAADFGCAHLEAIRELMIRPMDDKLSTAEKRARGSARSWNRTHANQQIGRIKRLFAWAVTKRLVPVVVHQELILLDGLREGKSVARETSNIRPVAESRALAILPFVSPQVAAMIRLHLATGMRSTEVCIVRPRDIDRTVTPWLYRPHFHKTQKHGIAREIPLGPKARAILEPYLDRDAAAFCFSPIEAAEHRRRLAREQRKTKVQPSQVLRCKLAKRRKKSRACWARYTDATYYRAVQYGCELAFKMPREWRWSRKDNAEHRKEKAKLRSEWYEKHAWHPHQIRHRTATDLRKAGGLETAQIVLGHTSKKMTEIYAEADVTKAHAVMELVG